MRTYKRNTTIGKTKIIELTNKERLQLEEGFRRGKSQKLQELVQQEKNGLIALYYGGESYVCTDGHVLYVWQFCGEDICIPSEKDLWLNIFGMIDRRDRYKGFTTTENMTANKVANLPDRMSLRISKRTFVALDNASVHRCRLIRGLRPLWEKRGLFLFFLPPYNPHFNIAETFRRIFKGEWFRPVGYLYTDALLYATNRALVAIESGLKINFKRVA